MSPRPLLALGCTTFCQPVSRTKQAKEAANGSTGSADKLRDHHRPEATGGEVAHVRLGRHVSCLTVVDAEHELVGIITDHDLPTQIRYHPFAREQYTFVDATTTPAHIEEVSSQVRTKLVS